MKLPSWLRRSTGRESRRVNGEESWLPAPALSGVPVTPATALAFGTFYAGVSVLSSDVARFPFRVVKRGKSGAKFVDESHPVHDLVFSTPDGQRTALGYKQSVMWHCLTQGNSYSEIVRDAYLRPVGLNLLDPHKVDPRRVGPDRELVYKVEGATLLARDVLHVANVGFDGIVGASPVVQGRETLGLGIAAEKFGAAYFGNGVNESAVLTTDQRYDATAAAAMRQEINQEHQGPYRAHRFMFLWNNLKWNRVSRQPNEAQFLETRQHQIEEVCRLLNMPPTKLQKWDKANYNSLEEANLAYYESSLLIWLQRFEAEWTFKLLDRLERRTWSIEHDASAAIRGRILDDANRDKVLRDMGVLSVNEIRAKHGWAPIEGGDTYFVPLNFAPLDKVAEASIETLKGVKAGPPPEPATDEVDVPVAQADGQVIEATRDVLGQVARRMVTRECNAVRKALRKGELSDVLVALDAHYEGEAEVLADAYGPALRALAAASGRAADPAAFARQLVEHARDEIRAIVEGSDTLANLGLMVGAWERDKATAIVEAAT